MSSAPATPPPSPQPRLFISSVSPEFKTLRMDVAKVTRQLGYHPVTMDDWSAGYGELQAWLRRELDSCEGIIHIPGIAYGAEPAQHDPAAHGLPADTPRYSYTQYEFLYAQQQGLKTWVITPGPHCTRDRPIDQLDLPSDPTHPDPAAYQRERRALQAAYLQRLRDQNHLRHQPADDKDLRLIIHTLRDHAEEMRQRFGQWQSFVTGYLDRLEKRTRLLRGLALGTVALIVLALFGIAWVKQDTHSARKTGQALLAGQEKLAAQMSQMQEALSRIQQNTDPQKAPISGWPQERLEKELAQQMQIKVEDLRALLTAGKTSLDALVQGQALLASGKRDQAGEKFDTVIQQEQSALQRLRQAYEGKAQIAYDQVRYAEALDYRQKAAALVDKATDPLGWAAAQGWVTFILHPLARYQEAEPLMREVLRLREQHLPPNHADIATALNDLAQVLRATNRLAEAEPMYRRALKIDEASYGPDHPEVATDLNNLAQLLQDTHRLTEAEPLMRRVVTIFEKAYGLDHPNVATALNNLAQLLQDTHRLTEAEPLMRRALQIDEASFGPDHPNVARDLNNLAALLKATHRLTEAEPMYRRALKIDEASYGPDHPKVAICLNNLARLCQDLGRLEEAEPLSRRMVGILVLFKERNGHEHPHFRTAVENYRSILTALKLPEEVVLEKLRGLGVEE